MKAAEAVPDVTLPELFERQVAQVPDAVAVVCGQTRWSYAEVEGRANRLARVLVSRGAGPGGRGGGAGGRWAGRGGSSAAGMGPGVGGAGAVGGRSAGGGG